MEFQENILGLIGNTPLIKLNRLARDLKATVFAKMENLNPGYSVKDRIGVAMIEAAEREGLLKPGGTVVEATSNTGIGLALAAAVKGYKCIFVMTDKASVEKSRYLKALGADVVITPVSAKPAHPTITYQPRNESPRKLQTLLSRPVFTPGKSRGALPHHRPGDLAANRRQDHALCRRHRNRRHDFAPGAFSEKNPNIKIIGADPYGSIFKTYKETGNVIEATPYLVEGIGQRSFRPTFTSTTWIK